MLVLVLNCGSCACPRGEVGASGATRQSLHRPASGRENSRSFRVTRRRELNRPSQRTARTAYFEGRRQGMAIARSEADTSGSPIKAMKNRTNTDRTSKLPALTLLLCAMFALLGVKVAVGQCIPHPEQRTVVLFANETKYDLTFFIDLDATGVAVPSKAVSPEQPVASGEHIFRARGIVGERAVWVWMIDEVPAGNVCTWIITDPAESTLPHSRKKQQE